jgi:hypothetical protein
MLEVNYMHITEKILNEIGKTLNNKYKVFVQPQEWALFKQPLTNKAGKMIKARFTKRQKKSVEIIRSILNVHGKTKIVKFLGQLASLEPQIQTLQPWVRDHVVHAINTFLIGVFILEKVNFPLFRGVRLDYPFMWKLCGLTHDLGYPIEIARNLQNQFVDKMNYILGNIKSPSPKVIQGPSPTNLDKLCEHIDSNTLIQERLTDWALGIEIEDYYDWLQLKNKTDHGVISALAQLKVIDALYYKVNPKRKNIDIVRENHNFNQKNFSLDIVSASSALFIHNINLNYYGFSNKISFELAPLAFLLFLCDTFQEWDRYSKNRLIFSGNDFDIHCQHHSISLFVPEELEDRIFATLFQRLTGLLVKINGRIAVT